VKTIPRKNSTFIKGLVALLLLPSAFFFFCFFNYVQLIYAFGDKKQTDVVQIRLYPLMQKKSIDSNELQSSSTGQQVNRLLTKMIMVQKHVSTQESWIKINERKCFASFRDKRRGLLFNQKYIPNKAHENERRVAVRTEGDKLKQDSCTSSNLPEIIKEPRKFSLKTLAEENVSNSKKKIGGAQGELGNFFEGVSSTPSKGAYRIEVTPRISIEEEYDDNIFLRKSNIVSDYTTTLSPGIKAVANSDTNGIDLDYQFGWVKYHNNTRNDYVRHVGALKLWQKLSNHLTFRLEDFYIKSDDILAALNQIPVSQRIPDPETLQAYQRNIARAFFEYQFGPESQVSSGYVYNFTDNEDPNLEDINEYGPFINLSYWYNQRNGLELEYEFLRYDYHTNGTAVESRPDLDRQDILGRYIRRFGDGTSGLLQYGLFIRDYPDVSVNYQIHDFSFGFEHAFSSRTSVALGTGYYRATGDTTIKPGYNFLASIDRNFERGSLSLSLVHSFDQGYNEVVPRGFTVYSQGLLDANYSLRENLNFYGNLSYRRNDYSEDDLDIIGGERVPDDQTYRGRCGITWNFYRWASLDLGYLYTKRISDDPDFDFDDNRVTLKLTGSYLYKW
jgi:putative beta-barrel porin BBP2